MRFFEINKPVETDQIEKTEPTMKDTDIDQNQQDQEPAPEQQKPVYASFSQVKALALRFEKEIPEGKFTGTNKGGTKPVPHIRIQKVSPAELRSLIEKVGGKMTPPDTFQLKSSGKFNVYAFEIDGVSYPVVIGSVKGNEDESAVGIGRKELSPVSLGLAGKSFNKTQLVRETKKAVEQHIRDETLKEALINLVDIASAGGVGKLPPELAEYISPIVGTISQDFGEILSPILIMDESDTAEFPEGNSPLIDVRLSNINLSVKALTGSGTSFKTISNLMDKYEESISEDKPKKEKYSVLKSFHPSQGGKNVDKIIAAAATAKTPEYLKTVEILGEEFRNYSQLSAALKNKITYSKNTLPYSQFLELVYPAMVAGDWGTPVGLPADGKFYLGQKTSPTKEKSAGKPSYDIDPIKGGANILTYMLGVGLLNMVLRGGDAEVYSSMMTDIVNKANAVLGHITIKDDGSMKLTTQPFSDLKFKFQYHAPSHIPGNNLPGFIAILD
jgi:hypothetical protein